VEVSCIVLAGGKSKRLGKDKALLILNKKHLISYVLDVARKFFSDVLIVVKNEGQKKKLEKFNKRLKIFEDRRRIFSPIAGIKEGIKHVKNDYVFVIGCDMPFIKEKTIRELLPLANGDVDCIGYAQALNRYEPLCAIYKKKVFEGFDLEEGLHHLIDRIDNKVLVPVSKETLEFFNVNTKEDLKFARKMVKSLKSV